MSLHARQAHSKSRGTWAIDAGPLKLQPSVYRMGGTQRRNISAVTSPGSLRTGGSNVEGHGGNSMPVARRSTELEKRIRNFAWMLGQSKMSKVRFRVGLVMLLWCRGPGARREESQRKPIFPVSSKQASVYRYKDLDKYNGQYMRQIPSSIHESEGFEHRESPDREPPLCVQPANHPPTVSAPPSASSTSAPLTPGGHTEKWEASDTPPPAEHVCSTGIPRLGWGVGGRMGLRGFSGWIQVTVDRMGLELERWWFPLPRALRTALREAQMQVHVRVGARDCSSAGQDLLLSPDVRRRGKRRAGTSTGNAKRR
ncbi:hypothetical protein B0H14DRAFT_2602505 [Mycena olivaceomarginata]|nr:hypothetical protein B0H14DRAFT_2602505 [Mycena olivaceomarginata]